MFSVWYSETAMIYFAIKLFIIIIIIVIVVVIIKITCCGNLNEEPRWGASYGYA